MAPASGHTRPGGLPDQIIGHLREQAGEGLRLQDLSRALFPDAPNRSRATITVGNELKRLHKQGRVQRVRVPVPGRVRPLTFYYAAVQTPS